MKSALSSTPRVMLLAALTLVAATLLSPSLTLAQDGTPVKFTFDFETGAQGWTVGFADLPVDYGPVHLRVGLMSTARFPTVWRAAASKSRTNRSDDLFMFLKRQVDGLRPNTAYAVSASLDLATNVPAGLVGIGGSPERASS